MLFAGVVPKHGLFNKHWSLELPKNLQNMRYHKLIRKCDGGPPCGASKRKSRDAGRLAHSLRAQKYGTIKAMGQPRGLYKL